MGGWAEATVRIWRKPEVITAIQILSDIVSCLVPIMIPARSQMLRNIQVSSILPKVRQCMYKPLNLPALPLPRTPLPGSPRQLGHTASCRKPSLPALGQPHLPARVLCTLPLAAGPVRARSRCSFSIYLLLPTAGAAGRVCRALPAPGVKGDLSEGVGVSPGPAS